MPWSDIAGTNGSSIFSFFILFSIVAVSIYIPTNSARGLLFSTPSSVFIVCRFFGDGYSEQCKVILHYSFDLHFSDNERC